MRRPRRAARAACRYKDVIDAPDEEPSIDRADARALPVDRRRTTSCRSASRCGARCRPRSPARRADAGAQDAPRAADRRTSCRRCCSATASSRARRSSARCTSCSSRSAAARRSSICSSSSTSRRRCCKGLVARGLVDDRARRSWRAIRSLARARRARRHARADASRSSARSMRLARARARATSFLLHGITGSGKTLVYIELLRRVVLERGQDGDRARAGDRAHAADGRSLPRRVRRPDRRAALARSATASATTRGSRCAAARSASPSARARRSSRRSRTSARSSSTRSTSRATSRARRRATTRARWRSCARARRARSSCSAARRRASRAGRTRRAGKYALLTLPERVGGGAAADGRGRRPARRAREAHAERHARCGRRVRASVISEPLETALARRARRGRSRASCCSTGAATRRSCSAAHCGDVATCPNCSITLTYHRTPERLVCHYCQHDEAPRATCRALRRRAAAAARTRHAAGRAAARRALPDGAHRAHGRRHDEREVGARRDPRPRRRAARSTSCSARR